MEDILASIKRIIAEEGESATVAARARRASPKPDAAVPPAEPAPAEEVLELRHAMPAAEPEAPATELPDVVTAVAAPAATAPEPILSPQTAEASRGALDTLSRLVVRSEEGPGENTLEGLVRELLRPMLREWLDANLPAVVEKMVAREISRISGQR